MRNASSWLAIVVGTAVLVGQAWAQGAPGAIGGKLIDPNGNPITLLDADISVKNTTTAEVTTAVVLPNGEYVGHRPGTRRLRSQSAHRVLHVSLV